MLPKRLTNCAFDAVAPDRPAAVLFRDGETKPRGALLAGTAQNREKPVSAARGIGEDAAERGRVKKPVFFAKPVA